MAQTTILAAGTTAANATDVTIAAGGAATFSLEVTAGTLPLGASFPIVLVGGSGHAVAVLNREKRTEQVAAAGVWRISRPSLADTDAVVAIKVDQ